MAKTEDMTICHDDSGSRQSFLSEERVVVMNQNNLELQKSPAQPQVSALQFSNYPTHLSITPHESTR